MFTPRSPSTQSLRHILGHLPAPHDHAAEIPEYPITSTMRFGVLFLQTFFIICSNAVAQIDSGGGKALIGGRINHSSFGEAVQTGSYLVGDFQAGSGLVEKLYARQPGTLATPTFILESIVGTQGYSMDSTPGITGSTVPDGMRLTPVALA